MLGQMAIQEPVTIIEPQVGRARVHQYELLRTLGAGGMGVVYEAFQPHLRRRVALKVLSPHLAASPNAIHRFQREMAAIGQLSHPNIVQAFDAGIDQTTHYLAMEYVDGANVESMLQRVGAFPIADACEIIRQAALGLAYVHSSGIVHRDIKPANLLLSKAGEVKVADLGLACMHDLVESELLTAHGAVLGTYDYMSPEQAKGGKVGPESDIYSLGATFFRLLTGKPIFTGPGYNSSAKKLYGHINDPPPRLTAMRSSIPPVLDELMDRLLAKDPSGRPPSANEVIDVLGPLSKGARLAALLQSEASPPAAENTTQTLDSGATKERAAPEPRKKQIAASWIGRSSLVVLGGLAVLWLTAQTRKPESGQADNVPPPASGAERLSLAAVSADQASKDLAYLRWQSLLNRDPSKVIWPPDALSLVHFDRSLGSLNARCSDIGILRLGRIDVKSFRLRMELHQNRWQGDIGIILGLRNHPDVAGGFQAQGLLFYPAPVRDDIHRMALRRTHLDFTPNDDGSFTVRRQNTADSIIKMPAEVSETFDIQVLSTGLSHIRWAGNEVPELCSPDVNSTFGPQDYQGDCGIFLSSSDLVVSGVQLMPLLE